MAASATKPPPGQQQGAADATAPKRKRTDTSDADGVALEEAAATKKTRLVPPPGLSHRLGLTSSSDPNAATTASIIDNMESKYDVQLLSVASAAKIQNRVVRVVQHLRRGGGAEATAAAMESTNNNNKNATTDATVAAAPKTKPRVSILRARASDAGKLVSIAEIAKRELEKPDPDRGTSDEGAAEEQRWFQYIALGEEINQIPRDGDKSNGKGKGKSGKRDQEQKSIVEDTMVRRNRGGAGDDDTEVGNGDGDDGADNDSEDDDDDFETMKTPMERAIEGRPRLRGTPVMSIFLSRVSIEALKKQFGEQTNAPPPPPP